MKIKKDDPPKRYVVVINRMEDQVSWNMFQALDVVFLEPTSHSPRQSFGICFHYFEDLIRICQAINCSKRLTKSLDGLSVVVLCLALFVLLGTEFISSKMQMPTSCNLPLTPIIPK